MLKKHSLFIASFGFLLLTSNIALANTQDDIIAYEKALALGDANAAETLLKQAFENSLSQTQNNELKAKIGYDYGYFLLTNDKINEAFIPLANVKKILEANPNFKIENGNDEFNFLYNLANFQSENYYSKLANSLNIIEKNKREDDLANIAAKRIAKYYYEKSQWDSLYNAAQSILTTNDNFEKNNDKNKDANNLIGHFYRGQAGFAISLNKSKNKSKFTNIKDVDKNNWKSPYIDFRKAQLYYGKPKSEEDKSFAILRAWLGLTNAYAFTIEKAAKVKLEKEAIDKSLNIEKDTFDIDEFDNFCDDKIKINYKVRFPSSLTSKYMFASANVVFDMDNKINPNNIRILASIPATGFDNVIINGLKESEIISISPDASEKCFKNRRANFIFITK